MSNAFKVIDTQTGEDVTRQADPWFIDADGDLSFFHPGGMAVADPDRYQVRRSTGISDREEALWKLLDNISTAGDAFKPDLSSPFVRYVLDECEKKQKYLHSPDGYTLAITIEGEPGYVSKPQDVPGGPPE